MKRIELNLDLYKKLYLIRKSEEGIRVYYHENDMKTPMHMSMGAEAIAAGVCHSLKAEDQIFGTYRSHAIYLAKTGETDNFFAEMYGKATSLQKGVGGSMHLCAPHAGFIGTSAIVGSNIPVAIGAAFANKRKRNGKLVAVFFGDGAIDEGTFWESVNIACLMKLPVLFVCEDNQLAVHTPASSRHGYLSITEIVSKFNCNVFEETTTDAERIYELTKNAIQKMNENQYPCFIHLKYYRYLEHVGINEDFEEGYRPKDEFEEWLKRDPIATQRKKLLECGCSETVIQKIEREIELRIEKSIQMAKEAPSPDKNELYNEVFAHENDQLL
jgi:pyruvate dehydrogenase E1 component alpha subunit